MSCEIKLPTGDCRQTSAIAEVYLSVLKSFVNSSHIVFSCYDAVEMVVLYRKYRPKTFDEVVGQEHVVQTLTNALRLNRVGHAYLFSGPRGTGKTTVARLLARYVNCVPLFGGQSEPLTKGASAKTRWASADGGLPVCEADTLCVNCRALFSGSNPDLVEIDAASNRGIDEIRQLREGARVAPMQSQYKVYIIDEAHMLTKEAANALLKILEEPPAHVMFVLATTDVEKLPATVHSRCQRFDFRLLTVPEITRRLAALANAERATIEAEAVDLLAQAADGSIRDGESLLEQVLVFLGERAGREDVMRLLGIPDPLIVRDIAGAILSGNTQQALEGVTAVMEKGGDVTVFATRLASYLRDVLLLNVDPFLAPVVEKRSGSAHVAGAIDHAALADRTRLISLIPKFIEAAELTKRSPIPQLPIELVIIETAQTEPRAS